MTTGTLTTKTRQQWLKAALIPALVLVLIAVLCWPAGNKDAVTEAVSLADSGARRQTPKDAEPPVQSKWPKLRLEEVIAFNPFDPPKVPPPVEVLTEPSEPSESPETEAEPRSAVPIGRLQAVYFDAQGAAAILDSKVIRVGDTLPNGRRIVEITSRGIKLEELQ